MRKRQPGTKPISPTVPTNGTGADPVIGVRLQVGDRIKVGGSTYQVTVVSAKFALAAPERPRRSLLKLEPPVTTATVRLKPTVAAEVEEPRSAKVKDSSRTASSAPKAMKKSRKRTKVGKIIAVSDSKCAQVSYRSAFGWPYGS